MRAGICHPFFPSWSSPRKHLMTGSAMHAVCSGYLRWQGIQRENNSSNKGTARNCAAISTAVGEGSTINCSKGCESKGNIAFSGAEIVL